MGLIVTLDFQDLSVVRPNHDLQAQLTHRKERLSFLIKFINDNGVLTKVASSVSALSQFTNVAHVLVESHLDEPEKPATLGHRCREAVCCSSAVVEA